MDRKQVITVVDYMIGEKSIGVLNDEELSVPYSPELKAFLIAMLGDNTPQYGLQVTLMNHKSRKPFAAFLRKLANEIDYLD